MEPLLDDATTMNSNETIITLSEVDALKVKCALLEFQLLKTGLEAKLQEGVTTRDRVLDPIFSRYRGDHMGSIGFDPVKGCLILEHNSDEE